MCNPIETVVPLKFDNVAVAIGPSPWTGEARRFTPVGLAVGDVITGIRMAPPLATAGAGETYVPQLSVPTNPANQADYYETQVPWFGLVALSPESAKSPNPIDKSLGWAQNETGAGFTARPTVPCGPHWTPFLHVVNEPVSLWITTTDINTGVFNFNNPSSITFRVVRPTIQPKAGSMHRPETPNKGGCP